jgi:hypothetical protein
MNSGGSIVQSLIQLAIIVLIIAGMWKVFEKAGKPGWAAIIPIYNLIVLLQIIGKPIWWIVLFIIPIVNIVIWFICAMELAVCFGKSKGWGVGLLGILSFVGFPLLGFSAEEKFTPLAGA